MKHRHSVLLLVVAALLLLACGGKTAKDPSEMVGGPEEARYEKLLQSYWSRLHSRQLP